MDGWTAWRKKGRIRSRCYAEAIVDLPWAGTAVEKDDDKGRHSPCRSQMSHSEVGRLFFESAHSLRQQESCGIESFLISTHESVIVMEHVEGEVCTGFIKA